MAIFTSGLFLPLAIAFTAFMSVRWWAKIPTAAKIRKVHHTRRQKLPCDYNDIQPLESFDPDQCEPLQLRPWKPKYHLTMGLEKATFSEYLPLNNTLESRLALRRTVVAEHRKVAIGANPCSESAVKEFYIWLVRNYLPQRYPGVYVCKEENLTGPASTVMPLNPPNNVSEILRLIAENVDSEFFFLQREGDSYVARAFIDCYPVYFDPRHKLNKTLAQIHGPVPGYAAKLEKSIDRYFEALPQGQLVKRHNWAVMLEKELYLLRVNPLTILPLPVMKRLKASLDWLGFGFQRMHRDEVDGNEVNVRCERQTLHRLMENDDTIVFAFQTYQYPLRQIMDEGGGSALAEAIRGIEGGGVPDTEWFKGSVYWKDAVIHYLEEE